jgi:hypothetical protein
LLFMLVSSCQRTEYSFRRGCNAHARAAASAGA